jgi:hypothetical protein
MKSWCVEIKKITHAGLDVFQMGIRGKNGMAGRRFLAGDYPVIAFSGHIGGGKFTRVGDALSGVSLP